MINKNQGEIIKKRCQREPLFLKKELENIERKEALKL